MLKCNSSKGSLGEVTFDVDFGADMAAVQAARTKCAVVPWEG